MSLQAESTTKQVMLLMENLAYNGLNLISKENFRQVELFLHNTSKLGLSRLSISLRYLHIELERFLNKNSIFDTERYVMFLSNCWLLSRGFLSSSLSKEKRQSFEETLIRGINKIEKINELSLSLIGIEKIYNKGTWYGFIFHLICLSGEQKGKIFQWNYLKPLKEQKGNKLQDNNFSSEEEIIQPDILLIEKLDNSEPRSMINTITTKSFLAKSIPYSKASDSIYIMGDPNTKIIFSEDFNEDSELNLNILNLLNAYDRSASNVYRLVEKKSNITPFEQTKRLLDYIYLKNVQITKFTEEISSFSKTKTFIVKIQHKNNYLLYMRIFDKPINQKLVKKLESFYESSEIIEGLFGKLFLQRGQLVVDPLSIVNEKKLNFICLSKKIIRGDSKAIKALMDKLYEK